MSNVSLTTEEAPGKRPRSGSEKESRHDLSGRIRQEVDAAHVRVQMLRKAADQRYEVQSKKCQALGALAEQVYAILKDRIGALLTTETFQDLTVSEKDASRVGIGSEGFGKHITIAIPHSDRCLAKVALEFHLDGDLDYDKLLLDYKLEILPIYLKFKANDQFAIRSDAFSAAAVTSWIDDRIIGFVRTYFEIYFSEYYQSGATVHDPVLNISFPKAFASGNKKFNGTTYYMFTAESQRRFEDHPGSYTAKQ